MNLSVTGRVRVFQGDVLVEEQKNLVVDVGLDAIVALIGSAAASPSAIGPYSIPTVGTAPNTRRALETAAVQYMRLGYVTSPAAPAATDTALIIDAKLVSQLSVASGLSISFLSAVGSRTIRFTGTIPADTWNAGPSGITEEELVTGITTMFAKVRFTTPHFTTDVLGLTFQHDIKFSGV